MSTAEKREAESECENSEGAEIINFTMRMTTELLQAGKTPEQALAEVLRLGREKWPHLWTIS